MTLSVLICLSALVCLAAMLRSDRISLGLPFAYLAALFLEHVPGAFARLMNGNFLIGSTWIETGIGFTAVASLAFIGGVWLARFLNPTMPRQGPVDRHRFFVFCVLGGWFFNYGVSFLRGIPTLGAALDKGSAIWMLGVMLGLRVALRNGDVVWMAIWLAALAVFPILTLLYGGFLSYGALAVIIVCSILVISVRSRLRITVGAVLAVFVGLTLFVNYYVNRDNIRAVVWRGAAGFEQRVEAAKRIFTNFEWFDPSNARHQIALDERLNQNYFVGRAADRIERGQTSYLYGRSLWEALLSLIPRYIWPNKSVFGGSGDIVAQMTGLVLARDTSWGVGNVMEFYINFGIAGLIIGFIILGWLLGMLDRKAAIAESRGDLGRTIVCFLPAAALIQPLGSMVELTSGSVIALVAAYGWKWAWEHWFAQPTDVPEDPLLSEVSRH
jgi:hypothetical protein